jgi:ribosomal protein S3AE
MKKFRGKNKATTKHWDKISDEHICIVCKKNKYETHFTVQTKNGYYYTRHTCNSCRGKEKPSMKEEIRKRIKEYFDDWEAK